MQARSAVYRHALFFLRMNTQQEFAVGLTHGVRLDGDAALRRSIPDVETTIVVGTLDEDPAQ